MSKSSNASVHPKSIRQKRILEIAEQQPDASIEEIAAEVPSVGPEIVEQVLDEYDDPANEEGNEVGGGSVAIDGPPSPETPTSTSTDLYGDVPNPETLSERELETLRAIQRHPDKTQRELGKVLDISGATVSQRVNSIEGFEWERRADFAAAVLDDQPAEGEEYENMSYEKEIIEESVDDLEARIVALEDTFAEIEHEGTRENSIEHDLLYKTIRECITSEAFDEDEEKRLMEHLL